MAGRAGVLLLAVAGISLAAGCVKERCYQDGDCSGGRVCGASGTCVFACVRDADCGEGFRCADHRCLPKPPPTPVHCPEDMALIADSFCVDRYEASRPDATADSAGREETRAFSRAGVLPWLAKDNAVAKAACEAAGKRLCTPAEWETACRGPSGTIYGYGDDYDPGICNGIETFGPGRFHLVPTGSFPECTNPWGVFDMNGNVWEHVLGGDGTSVRGGAFNCSDSRTFHRCDYVPRTWTPAALGFRCCLGAGGTPDPGPEADAPDGMGELPADGGPEGTDEAPSSDPPQEGGCMPTDDGAKDPGAGDVFPPDPGATDPGISDPGPGDPGPADASPGDLDSPLPDPDAEIPDHRDAPGETGTDPGADPGPPPPCPDDMRPVPIGSGRTVCIDRYEASRADATAGSEGASPVASSRPGVLPWYVSTMSLAALAEFTEGCRAAGKRICTKEEWFEACNGPGDTTYFFGDAWNRETCNSVDAFCDEWCAEKGISPCNTSENCGYQYYCFHVVPTGTFPDCRNPYGLYDVNGNVWEVVPVEGSRGYEVRGGAFNCGSPSVRFRCDFNATWDGLFAGFRCCRDPR